jgi:hypothetical protein
LEVNGMDVTITWRSRAQQTTAFITLMSKECFRKGMFINIDFEESKT